MCTFACSTMCVRMCAPSFSLAFFPLINTKMRASAHLLWGRRFQHTGPCHFDLRCILQPVHLQGPGHFCCPCPLRERTLWHLLHHRMPFFRTWAERQENGTEKDGCKLRARSEGDDLRYFVCVSAASTTTVITSVGFDEGKPLGLEIARVADYASRHLVKFTQDGCR
jgi:hypothetical protein